MRHHRHRPLTAALVLTLSSVAAAASTGLTAPQDAAPQATEQNPGQAQATTAAAATTPATQATRTTSQGASATLNEENIVTGADAQDIDVDGVDTALLEDAPSGAPAEDIAALTSEHDTPTFEALGVTWDSDTTENVTSVKVRLRENGTWTEWNDLLLIGDRVETISARTGTDPILTNGATGYEVEVITDSGNQPSGLQVNLVNPGTGTLDNDLVDKAKEIEDTPSGTLSTAYVDTTTGAPTTQAATLTATADSLRPTIVTRAAWGADESVTYDAPQNKRVSAMYLHHTASSNNYTKEQAAAQVRSIHYYQAVTLDWGDIGYHFIVDKFGTIYEGARGSITSKPMGAHALGFNTDTIGVSAMGQYGDVPPSSAMLDSLARVFAWKAAQNGLDPQGKTTLVSAGNSANPAGTRVNTDIILGHYLTNATACPGQYLIAKLPEIRANAAKLVKGTAVPAPTPTTPETGYSAGTYTVQAGDGWYAISSKTKVAVNALLTLNKATLNTELHPGMVLKTGSTTTASPTPTNPATSASTYTVQPNDGWWTISQKTKVSQADLQALNGMSPSTVLHPGMVLKTTAATATPTPSTGTGTYTVQANDGWWLISQKTGVPQATLFSLNGMTVNTVLHPGMVLKTGTGSNTDFEYAPPQTDANPLWTPADRLKFTDVTAGVTTNGTHVQWVADAGVSKGYADSTFRQGTSASRTQVAQMLYEYMTPLGTFGTRATDVAAANREAVGYVVSRSAMGLYADGTFRGTGAVSRADFAKMLSRATGSTVPTAVGTNLKDVPMGSKNSGHIEWAYKQGLMGANSSGQFEPNRAVTRGEVARALSVLFSNGGGKMAMVDYAYEVNVRSGPGTSYAVLGRVKIDSLVRIIKKDPSGVWAFVKNESFTGWVHTDYLR